VIYYDGGAHHLDFRDPNEADPTGVKEARDIEIATIKEWISNFSII